MTTIKTNYGKVFREFLVLASESAGKEGWEFQFEAEAGLEEISMADRNMAEALFYRVTHSATYNYAPELVGLAIGVQIGKAMAERTAMEIMPGVH